ncbi:histidine-type phosphatase [Roseomonas elaeocarpi]|uniref:Histidine-type phosphatase n=1 Tax=Roseomonas elaeocarpi TaxID=907779 RepID=A0ABV6JYU8_9PROT
MLAGVLVGGLLGGIGSAGAQGSGQEMVLEKVVTLMRHGVRPPTESAELAHYTDQPWPSWPVADGQLTPHGVEAISQLGRWERAQYAAAGLLPAEGCPAKAEVFAWANRGYARTIDTGKAMLAAMFPGCGLEVGVAPGKGHDPLFTARQTEVGRMNPAAAQAAILEKMGGSFDRPRAELAALLPPMQAMLGCCAAVMCPDKGATCSFGDLPWGFTVSSNEGNVDLRGPLNTGSTVAQVILLEYLEGMPAAQVGWGQAATRDEVMRLAAIRLLKYRYMEGVPYIARHGASNIARQINLAVEQGAGIRGADSDMGPPPAKLVLFVGSDTQIAELGTLLDAHWQSEGYLADETPPGGALSFELLRTPDGRRFVRTVFLAQSPDQIRAVSTLGADNAPSRSVVMPAFCKAVAEGDACPVAAFSQGMRAVIDMTAVSVPAWRQH